MRIFDIPSRAPQDNWKNEQCIKFGDVVLVHDDIPRVRWKMAVVEQLIQGKDGYTRADIME